MTDLHKEHSDLTARVEALEAENDRLKRLLEERNQISGTVMLRLRDIAGAVFPDYPLEGDFARLVSAVKSLVERQPPVPLMSALMAWLEGMERRSANSITKADAHLAKQAEAWLTQATSVAPHGVYQAVDLLNRALRHDPEAVALLVEHRVTANEDLMNDPTIQCIRTAVGAHEVGLLGIINGIFGIRKDSVGWIAAVFDGDTILRFEVNEPKEST